MSRNNLHTFLFGRSGHRNSTPGHLLVDGSIKNSPTNLMDAVFETETTRKAYSAGIKHGSRTHIKIISSYVIICYHMFYIHTL